MCDTFISMPRIPKKSMEYRNREFYGFGFDRVLCLFIAPPDVQNKIYLEFLSYFDKPLQLEIYVFWLMEIF